MDATRGKKRPAESQIVVEEKVSSVDGGSYTEDWLQLRARWELASVLNFLNVFRSLINGDLVFTAEEIEMALIKPDGVLAAIHIALMKGIPPVSKNMGKPDAWVTVLCRKIHTWWPWVAEGDLPLVANHGAEIAKYKEFHPTTRLLILKALCEIRAEQDDLPMFIDEELRSGTPLSTFRRDKISGGMDKTSYWCDGDLVIGYRLYKEILLVDSKSRPKGKGCLKKPSLDFSWEIIATNMEEFQELSVKFSESNNVEEVAAGNFIKDKILPDFEKIRKKKDRALKKQQREVMLLSGFLAPPAYGSRRSCRDRRPATYTFAEYDRSINEAIQMEKKHKARQMLKCSSTGKTGGLTEDNATSNGTANDDDDDDDDDDYDYSDERENGGNANYYLDESGKGKGNHLPHGHSRPALKQKCSNIIEVGGLRRSARNSCNANVEGMMGPDEMKKKLRQRPNHNVEYELHVIPDSDEENASEKDQSTGKSVPTG